MTLRDTGAFRDTRSFDTAFPTEEDRDSCPFYFKIGACRNGDRCNRTHARPERSQTVLLTHMYPSIPEALMVSNDEDWDDETYEKAQEHVEAFYEEVFLELAGYGEIEDLVVLDNSSDHMLGNMYCKYYHEDAAVKAVNGLQNRFYGARLVLAEFSPVTDFREARCRAFHETRCARGGLCNFMHIKHIPRAVKRRVVREMFDEHPDYPGAARFRPAQKAGEAVEPKRKAPKRQSSEERKTMIAEWNAEAQREALEQAPRLLPGAGAGMVIQPLIPGAAALPPVPPAPVPRMLLTPGMQH